MFWRGERKRGKEMAKDEGVKGRGRRRGREVGGEEVRE